MNNSESSPNIQTKVCSKCKLEKDILNFSKSKRTKDSLKYQCKSCRKETSIAYSKTKEGLFSQIYKGQIGGSKKRGHNPPSYTKQELINWFLAQPNFEKLYNDWVNSDYKKDLKPSADRPNDYLGYTLDNIQLMTWKENLDKSYKDRKNGINNKVSKAVIGTNIKTGKIVEFHSIAKAGRELNTSPTSISLCCLNRKIKKGFKKNGDIKYYTPKSAAGYSWSYK